MHTGIDIASRGGTPIHAAASGTVKFAGWYGGYGNYIIIDHGSGVETCYAHTSAIYVTAGQGVVQGQHIAAMGTTGNSSGNHLHFEVRVNGVYQNPQTYVFQ
jgi:murein DD-endopeptidase MepM/ murein hydrolase activator NlpD